MQTIYHYNIDGFDKTEVINKINEISNEIQKEQEKNDEEYSRERERELLYAQFIQGLRLSIK